MANVVGFKSGVRAWGKEREAVRVRYDFAKDGGAQGFLGLFSVSGIHIVADARAVGVTLPVGSGATISVGKSTDAAGIIAAVTAATALAAGAAAYPAAADHASNTLADGDIVGMTIGTADLTAGVVDFLFELIKAS